MKPVFEIVPEAIFFHQTNLICEVSSNSFSYIFENDAEKKVHGLSVFYLDKNLADEQLKQIYNDQPLLKKSYKKIIVSYACGGSVLLPEEIYKPEQNELILNTIHGETPPGYIATDFIADKMMYNVYRIPERIHGTINELFPLATLVHQFTSLTNQNFSSDVLKTIFYKDEFIVLLIKEGKLQILKRYPYQSATDVVYYLLTVCKQFKADKIMLELGGMVEYDSDLYKEIAHYFPNLTFACLPAAYAFANSLQQIPSHYFSHIFSLASCV